MQGRLQAQSKEPYSGCIKVDATNIATPTSRVTASAGSTKLMRIPNMCCSLSAEKLTTFRLANFVFCRSGKGGRCREGALPLKAEVR